MEFIKVIDGRRSKETLCQDIRNLNLFTVYKIIFENRNVVEHFAIYSAELEQEVLFEPTEETTDLLWFKPEMEVSKICITLKKIIEYYENQTQKQAH